METKNYGSKGETENLKKFYKNLIFFDCKAAKEAEKNAPLLKKQQEEAARKVKFISKSCYLLLYDCIRPNWMQCQLG